MKEEVKKEEPKIWVNMVKPIAGLGGKDAVKDAKGNRLSPFYQGDFVASVEGPPVEVDKSVGERVLTDHVENFDLIEEDVAVKILEGMAHEGMSAAVAAAKFTPRDEVEKKKKVLRKKAAIASLSANALTANPRDAAMATLEAKELRKQAAKEEAAAGKPK